MLVAADRDRVWAIEFGAFDVPSVVAYRIEIPRRRLGALGSHAAPLRCSGSEAGRSFACPGRDARGRSISP